MHLGPVSFSIPLVATDERNGANGAGFPSNPVSHPADAAASNRNEDARGKAILTSSATEDAYDVGQGGDDRIPSAEQPQGACPRRLTLAEEIRLYLEFFDIAREGSGTIVARCKWYC